MGIAQFVKHSKIKFIHIFLKIEEGIISISENIFSGCPFENIVIPDGVIEIEDFAFMDCQSLKNILIPKSVEKIGANSFSESEIIQAYEDSVALQHAHDNGILYKVID